MALGFGAISAEPLDSLPHFSIFFDEESYLVVPFVNPVAFLTADPLKRLVFAVEIDVLPLTGAPVPTFGSET